MSSGKDEKQIRFLQTRVPIIIINIVISCSKKPCSESHLKNHILNELTRRPKVFCSCWNSIPNQIKIHTYLFHFPFSLNEPFFHCFSKNGNIDIITKLYLILSLRFSRPTGNYPMNNIQLQITLTLETILHRNLCKITN